MSIPSTDQRPHSIHGFSKLDTLAACRHFVSDQSSDTTAADRGTLLHEQIGQVLNSEDPVSTLDALDSPDKDAIAWAISAIDNMILQDARWSVETRLETTIPTVWGYLDLLHVEDDPATIVEIKSGWSERNGSKSYQIMGQALAVMERYPLIDWVDALCLEVDKRQASSTSYTRNDIPTMRAEILGLLSPDSPYNFGKQCAYCQQRHTCNAPKIAIMDFTTDVIDQHPAPTASTADIADFLAAVEANMKAATKICDALKADLIKRLEAEGDNYGWAIKRKSRGQQWRDEYLIVTSVNQMLPNQSGMKPISPAQFRKVAASAGIPKSQIEDFIERNAVEQYATQLVRTA